MSATDATVLSLDDARTLAVGALRNAGASDASAVPTAEALVQAEADGQTGHGLSRIGPYVLHLKTGKVDGCAVPRVQSISGAAVRVDAASGFAYPAIDLALHELERRAREQAIALAVVHRSHHFGVAGAHAERLARRGLIGIVLGNTPKAMPFWGGRRPMLGTNPLAFAAPMPDSGAPLVIDLALSVAARGKIVAAQRARRAIPDGWAVGADGEPTNDPGTALAGALLPIGGAKGGALALMVEVLAAAVCGSAFGWEASSMFDGEGGPPDIGQLLIALDPRRLSGGAFDERMRTLMTAMQEDPAVRLPGLRRLEARQRATHAGLLVPEALVGELRTLSAEVAGA